MALTTRAQSVSLMDTFCLKLEVKMRHKFAYRPNEFGHVSARKTFFLFIINLYASEDRFVLQLYVHQILYFILLLIIFNLFVFLYYFFENKIMDTVEQELTCPWFFWYWDYQYALSIYVAYLIILKITEIKWNMTYNSIIDTPYLNHQYPTCFIKPLVWQS